MVDAAVMLSRPDEPPLPDDFDEEHAAKWAEVLALLRARGAPISEYGDVVRLYVQSFIEAKRARAHVRENGPVVPAPRTGTPIHNPYRKVAQEAEYAVTKLAEVLGMTPTSRGKVARALPPAPIAPGDGELGRLQLGHFAGAVDLEVEDGDT